MATSLPATNSVNSASGAPRRPPAFVNKIMSLLLQSPLHGILSENLMLLTFTGRKSGKQFTTPVTYSRSANKIIVFSSNRWWKNLENNAPVTMRIKGQVVQGSAEITNDHAVVLREIHAYLAKKGVKNARMIGLTTLDPKREPTQEELAEATQGRAVIFIEVFSR